MTSHPFTIALCTACTSELTQTVVGKLRTVVGNCPHGVLVVTQCLLDEFTCATGGADGGVMLLLQPCTVDRAPVAAVQWLGPISNVGDADAACVWIAAGGWNRQN